MINILTKGAESLLQEIIEHRNENGIVDADYFFKKLEAMNQAEDDLYRSCFKELSDYDLAKTHWADNGPYMISLTSAGMEYFEQKKAAEKEERKEKRNKCCVWRNSDILTVQAVRHQLIVFRRLNNGYFRKKI